MMWIFPTYQSWLFSLNGFQLVWIFGREGRLLWGNPVSYCFFEFSLPYLLWLYNVSLSCPTSLTRDKEIRSAAFFYVAMSSAATGSDRKTEKEVGLSEFCSIIWEGGRGGNWMKAWVLTPFHKWGSGRDVLGQQGAALLQHTPSLEQAAYSECYQ